jgi:hypothetical protein
MDEKSEDMSIQEMYEDAEITQEELEHCLNVLTNREIQLMRG